MTRSDPDHRPVILLLRRARRTSPGSSGLARHINDHLSVPSATETVKVLMRPATVVPAGTPLSAIAQPIADDGIIVVSGSGDRPVGYLTTESVLTQVPRVISDHPTAQDRSPLLIPGTGAVLLNRG
jgi:hypothetical protein